MKIKKLAKDFNLKYNPNWFRYLWISVKHEVLMEYIGMSLDPIYQKYGKNAEQRIKNIDKFVKSKDFKICLKRYGGQVLKKSDLNKNEKLIKKIDNGKLKNELLKFLEKVKKNIGNANYLATLTTPRNEKERKWQMKILRHEWIHILLYQNKLRFQDINKKFWPYDEGINEYLGSILDKTLEELEIIRDKENYPIEKKYWIYAIKFRELLKNKKTPKERKGAVLSLISSLKRK
jgi:hypothetical protein